MAFVKESGKEDNGNIAFVQLLNIASALIKFFDNLIFFNNKFEQLLNIYFEYIIESGIVKVSGIVVKLEQA